MVFRFLQFKNGFTWGETYAREQRSDLRIVLATVQFAHPTFPTIGQLRSNAAVRTDCSPDEVFFYRDVHCRSQQERTWQRCRSGACGTRTLIQKRFQSLFQESNGGWKHSKLGHGLTNLNRRPPRNLLVKSNVYYRCTETFATTCTSCKFRLLYTAFRSVYGP